jgi:hypothetical protein
VEVAISEPSGVVIFKNEQSRRCVGNALRRIICPGVGSMPCTFFERGLKSVGCEASCLLGTLLIDQIQKSVSGAATLCS